METVDEDVAGLESPEMCKEIVSCSLVMLRLLLLSLFPDGVTKLNVCWRPCPRRETLSSWPRTSSVRLRRTARA